MRRDVFQAIADPTRREIIVLIANKSLTLNSVADSFAMSRQAISKHIKILTECGIIVINQQGRERYCFIQPEKLSEVANFIEPFRKMWDDRFNKLEAVMKRHKTEKHHGAKNKN